ncbi:hypothetical protein QL285_043622 [Trifolium repens]|nr:hypothetical protein QL285_043622 [Trifolium repens]
MLIFQPQTQSKKRKTMGFVNLCANEASVQIGIKSPEVNIPHKSQSGWGYRELAGSLVLSCECIIGLGCALLYFLPFASWI